MARNAGTFVENQFVQGLITEATGFNFPEKAVIETWNTRFDKTGEVKRRYGFDAEAGVQNTALTATYGARVSFLWKNPGKTDQTFLVAQVGRYLAFWEYDSSGDFSSGLKSFNIDLADYRHSSTIAEIRNNPCNFTSAEGKLFVVHQHMDPLFIDYDADTDTITATDFILEIRDVDGIDDGLEPDENPLTLTNLHKYNLWNQGWNTGPVSAGFNNSHANAIEFYRVAQDEYPNNCQVWWAYKGANSEGKESLQYNQTNMVLFGNSLAPRGHYIYNAFDINRTEASGLGGLPREQTDLRPTCVALFAGRIWYAGVDDKVYYSQVIVDDGTYGKCYQKNDPTSETLSDLLDTDGGVIKVLGVGKATGLFAAGGNLFVFSPNGIWVITGSGADGTGFVATNFAIRRISTVGLLSSVSLLDVEGSAIWWNLEGIWTFQQDKVVSLTDGTIKTFLDEELPVPNRAFVQGAFNPSERTIQWLFRSTAAASTQEQYEYDRILELNTDTGAFYPFKWHASDTAMSTIFCVTGITTEETAVEYVVDSADVIVTDSGGNAITATVSTGVAFRNGQFKYVEISNVDFTFLEEVDEDYLDFTTRLGAGRDFESYFISGAKVHGEGKAGSIEYITVFCKSMDGASVRLQTKWDWANLGSTGKWSTPQECYTVNRANRDVSRKRLLVRGQGPAIQLHFSSVSGAPFNVIGWSSFETVDTVP